MNKNTRGREERIYSDGCLLGGKKSSTIEHKNESCVAVDDVES